MRSLDNSSVGLRAMPALPYKRSMAETTYFPRRLILGGAMISGVLLALAVHMLGARYGLDLGGLWRSDTTDFMPAGAAIAWWLIATVGFSGGYFTATLMDSAVSGEIPMRMRQFLIAVGVLVLAGAGQAAAAPSPIPTLSGVLDGPRRALSWRRDGILRRAFCAAQGVTGRAEGTWIAANSWPRSASVALSPLAARAQEAGRIYRLGVLIPATRASVEPFFDELRNNGFVEGQNLVVTGAYSVRAEQIAESTAALMKTAARGHPLRSRSLSARTSDRNPYHPARQHERGSGRRRLCRLARKAGRQHHRHQPAFARA